MKTEKISTQEFMKTEKELHQEFMKLGANRRKLTNELLALLPEIYDRKIHLKYASTIIEYAGKFGGLSKGVVLKRLRLEKYLSGKPKLRDAIKIEGVHKVALVASVATAETEEAWVDKLKNMSKNAIQELSKEVRNKEVEAKKENIFLGKESLFFGNENLFGGVSGDFGNENLFGGVSGDFVDKGGDGVQMASASALCKAAPLKITIELTDESAFIFLKLKKKFEKEIGKNSGSLGNKEVMNEILKRLTDAEFPEKMTGEVGETEGTMEKSENGKVILEDNFCEGKMTEGEGKMIEMISVAENRVEQKNNHEKTGNSRQKISRYIPVHVKKMAILRARGKCAYPNCGHPAEIFHHRERFAESKKRLERAIPVSDEKQETSDKAQKLNIHDSVIHLCKIHHEFAHNGIIVNESQEVGQWKLKIDENNLFKSDVSYREVRMRVLR